MPRGSSASRSALTGGASSAAVDAVEQQRDGAVLDDDVPVAVDRERRERLVRAQHQLDDRARRRHRRIVERPRGEHRRESGRGQQAVALAQRHVEAARKAQHHLAARCRAPRLEAAEVARRDVGGERELELAEPAARPPVADLGADGGGGKRGRHRARYRAASPSP
jgi:hypothetical protein